MILYFGRRIIMDEEKNKRYKNAYNENENRHGCGYWGVCIEHDCPCSPTAKVKQGYDFKTYESMRKAYVSELGYGY
jgi:hypothetical protein